MIPSDVSFAVSRRTVQPTTHENGFIQLVVGHNRRLHVWPDEPIVHQTPAIVIHDHRYDFESEVLVGRLDNVIYRVVPPSGTYVPSHIIATPPMDGSGEYKFHDAVRALVEAQATHHKGDLYHHRVRVLHETRAHGLTVTVITKTSVHEIIPRVLVPMGVTHVKPIDRENANPPDLLWKLIERALASAS